MQETERIKRINAKLDKHFKSNKGAWWVSNGGFSDSHIIELHRGAGGNRIKAVSAAKYILETEKSVNIVHYGGMCMIYTRESVKGYAPRKKKV